MLYAEADRTQFVGRSLCRRLTVRKRRDVLEETPRIVLLLDREIEGKTRAIVESTMDIAAYYGRLDGLIHIDKRVLEDCVCIRERQLCPFQVLGRKCDAKHQCQECQNDSLIHSYTLIILLT